MSMIWGGSLNARNFKRDIKDKAKAKAEATQGLLPTPTGKPPSQIRGGTWNILKHVQASSGSIPIHQAHHRQRWLRRLQLGGRSGRDGSPGCVQELIKKDAIHEWFIPNLTNGIPAHAPANSRGREFTDACVQWATKMMDPKRTSRSRRA